MSFQVRTLPRAEADPCRMAGFIRQRSKQGAISWLKAFETAKQRLESAADTFALSQENCDFDQQVREISFKTPKRTDLPSRVYDRRNRSPDSAFERPGAGAD